MAKQQKFKFDLPEDLTDKQKKSIALSVMEYIQKRSIDQNKGFNQDTGREFKYPRYTKEYAALKGSSRSDVNLINQAKMFNAMKVLKISKASATIGFESGTTENAKAEGNQLGTYGQPDPIPGKARPFLGIPKSKLDEIISKVKQK